MGTAIKHPVPDQVKLSFVNFWHQGTLTLRGWMSECPAVKNYKWWLNPVWHRMLYSCTHMAAVDVRGLISVESDTEEQVLLSVSPTISVHWLWMHGFIKINLHVHFFLCCRLTGRLKQGLPPRWSNSNSRLLLQRHRNLNVHSITS